MQPTVFPRYLTVADVINNVKCELQMAMRESNSTWLEQGGLPGKGWAAGFEITLQVFRQGSGTAELTLVVPYSTPPGTFRTGFLGGLSKSGQARITINFSADKNLAEFMKKEQCNFDRELSGQRNLAGNTGLRLWFGNAIEGMNRANITGQSTGLTYNLEFVTTLDGSIKPKFDRIFTPAVRTFTGDFSLGRQRKDTNSLTVAFTPIPTFVLSSTLKDILAELKKDEVEASREARAAEKEQARANSAYKSAKAQIEAKNAQLEQMPSQQALESVQRGEAPAQFTTMSKEDAGAQLAARNALVKEKEALENELPGFAQASIQANKIAAQAQAAESRARKAVAGARAAAGAEMQAPSVSANEQINQLLLRDAIRDIPRR